MPINAPYYIIRDDHTISTADTLAEARSLAKSIVLADEGGGLPPPSARLMMPES